MEQHKIPGNELILFEIAKTNNEMMAKSFWYHYDVKIIERGGGGGGGALEIVTDGKSDKP